MANEFAGQKVKNTDNRYNLHGHDANTTLGTYSGGGTDTMLAPKISLRQLMWGMVGVAVFLALLSTAWRGNLVTFGQCLAIALLPAVFLVYAITYWILYGLATWISWRLSGSGGLAYANSDSASSPEVTEPTK